MGVAPVDPHKQRLYERSGQMIGKFLKGRLREASTYRGLLVIVGMFGISFSPEQSEAIIGGCLAVYAVLAAFLPDKFGEKKDVPVPIPEAKEIERRIEPGPTPWNGKTPGQFP